MNLKGVSYDVGLVYYFNWRPVFDRKVVHREIEIIKDDLHCNAIRICGFSIDRLMIAAEDALDQGLEVWLSPELWNRKSKQTLNYSNQRRVVLRKVSSLLGLCIILLVSLVFLSFIGIKAVSSSNSALLGLGSSVQPVYAVSAATWHEGTNQYTSLANVTYGELYNTLSANQTGLTRTVWINYNDHTNASIGLTIRYDFNPGGLDISHQQVLNWSKLTYSDLGINTWGVANKTQVGTIYFFKGFDIIKGTSGNFTLSQTYYNNAQNAPGSYSYNVNNVVGGISYLNYSTAQISAVTLSTVNTTYKGIPMTDSIATFNVTFSAQISSKPLAGTLVGTSQNQTLINVPVVFMFQITHDAAHTQYKYGVYIDWSIMKAFPNWGGLKSGDSFCLVADDYLQFLYNNTKADDQFSSDANNDSAIYLVNGIELCRELFPVNYTISGSTQPCKTTRIYVPDAIYNPAATNTSKYDSKTFVCFSGFMYNQSSGFTFDPTIITPNSITASNIKTNTNTPTASNILTVIIPLSTAIVVIAAAATGTVVIVKRRRERRLNFNPTTTHIAEN